MTTTTQTVCFDQVDMMLLSEQYDALVTLLSHPETEDNILWGLVEMLGSELDSSFLEV